MLEGYGKAFEIRCVDLKDVERMMIFTIDHIPWNLKSIPVMRAHIPNGAIKCTILKSMVYTSGEERITTIHSRATAGEETHDPKIRSRLDNI
mgnify:CR=1 FL=1